MVCSGMLHHLINLWECGMLVKLPVAHIMAIFLIILYFTVWRKEGFTGDSNSNSKKMSNNIINATSLTPAKGECVVEVLKTGHFPTTAMVKLPNDKTIEVDTNELEIPKD